MISHNVVTVRFQTFNMISLSCIVNIFGYEWSNRMYMKRWIESQRVETMDGEFMKAPFNTIPQVLLGVIPLLPL